MRLQLTGEPRFAPAQKILNRADRHPLRRSDPSSNRSAADNRKRPATVPMSSPPLLRESDSDSRTRERTLGDNLSWLRRFAVTLLKRHPVKDSLRGKMIRCSLNTDFLTEVLTLQAD